MIQSFDANSAYLLETGPNSNIFEVIIKIPRQLDGKTIHISEMNMKSDTLTNPHHPIQMKKSFSKEG